MRQRSFSSNCQFWVGDRVMGSDRIRQGFSDEGPLCTMHKTSFLIKSEWRL